MGIRFEDWPSEQVKAMHQYFLEVFPLLSFTRLIGSLNGEIHSNARLKEGMSMRKQYINSLVLCEFSSTEFWQYRLLSR